MPKKLIAVSLLLCAAILFASSKPEEYEIHPKPDDAYQIKGDQILYREGNAGLILQLSTPQLISEYYSKRGIDLGDPFPALAPELKTATIFLLDLINHTHSALTFTPSYVALKVKDETLYPVDLTTLLPMLDDADTNQHKVIEKTVFHSPVIVYPDQVESRFLIFSKMPSRFDHFKMEFDYMFFKSKEMKCKFYFTRNKVGERPQTNK